MKYELSCRDLGMRDGFVTHGRTKAEVMTKMMRHARREHQMTDLELKDPMMKKMMKNRIHEAK